MKRNVFFTASVSVLALILTSCVTSIPSQRVSTIRVAEIKTAPLNADLKIDQTKKTGTAINRDGESVDALKIAAIADVLEKNNGDILLEPSFTIETKGSSITVNATGFVAKYENIRQEIKKEVPTTVNYDYKMQGSAENESKSVSTLHPGASSVVNTQTPQKRGLFGLGFFGL